jgi:outer membrane protein TolC
MKGVLLAALLSVSASAQTPALTLGLAQTEAAAREHSLSARAAAAEAAAAGDREGEQFASLLPRLTLDGYYRYQTVVPELSLGPGQPARPFGDHRATSIGPTLSWTLWDQGALYQSWRAQKARASSAEAQVRLAERQTLLGARLAYAQAQLAREQVLELSDSLSLADAEDRDIQKRFKAGSASRIDTLSSRQDSLQRRRQFLQAQAEFGAALRELFQLTGLGGGLDLARPLDARVSNAAAAGLDAPTLLVTLDDLSSVPPVLAAAENASLDPAHPALAAYAGQAEAARLTAAGLRAGRGPTVKLTARASYDYPNGPVLESVTQKSVGLTASLPLFEGRQIVQAVDEQKRLASAAESRRNLASEELARDWDKARVALSSLRAQLDVDQRSAADAEELAKLVYLSYRTGSSNYLEVQSANLRALEAKVQTARTRAQILIQLATLAALAQG